MASLPFVFGIENREVLADNFFARVPLESLSAVVPGGDTAIHINQKDRVVLDPIDKSLELLGPLAPCSLISERPFHPVCVKRDLDRRSQLAFVERLDQEAIWRCFLRAEDGLLVSVGSQEDDRHVELLADNLGGVDPIHFSV